MKLDRPISFNIRHKGVLLLVWWLHSMLTPASLHAQHWLYLIESGNRNFFEIEGAYRVWLDSLEKHTGCLEETGPCSNELRAQMKTYKQWYREHISRVSPDGNINEPGVVSKLNVDHVRMAGGSVCVMQSGDWQPIGPTYVFPKTSQYGNGLVNFIAVHPVDTAIIFAAVPGGGLWRTLDGGGFWEPLTDSVASTSIRCLTFEPVTGNSLFMALGDVLYNSTDLGITWTATPAPSAFVSTAGRLIIDPTDTQVMYLPNNGGVAKTDDGGQTWYLVNTVGSADLHLNELNPQTLYMSRAGVVYKSYDGGVTVDTLQTNTPWTPSSIAVTPADTNYIYVYSGVGSGTDGMVALSTDGGSTFVNQPVSNKLVTFNNLKKIFVSPTNKDEVYFAGITLEKSTDAGVNWDHIINYYVNLPGNDFMHVDQRDVQRVGNSWWFANDGGVYKTDDAGLNFLDITGNMQITELLSIAVSENDTMAILGGATHMGCIQATDSGWACVGSGDGIEAAINPVNSMDIFYKYQYGYQHSLDGGLTTVPITGITESQYSFSPSYPLVFNHQNPSSVFTISGNVFKSIDGGLSFSKITNFPSNTIQNGVLEVSTSDSNFIYIGTHRSHDGGITWIPWNRYILDIAIDSNQPWRIWTASYQNSKVIVEYSADSGNTFVIIPTPDLPSQNVRDLEYINNGFDGLLLVLTYGMYYIDNRLSNWQPFRGGLPEVELWDAEPVYAVQKIRLATGGRGFWESPMYDASQPPVADFFVTQDTLCPGGSVRFYDNSLNHGPGFNPTYSWSFPGGVPAVSSNVSPVVQYPSPGIYTVSLTISNINGTDSVTKVGYITVFFPPNAAVPFSEDFESVYPPQQWIFDPPSSITSWWRTDDGGGYGLSTYGIVCWNTTLFPPVVNSFLLPPVDISGLSNPILYFDRAYAMDTLLNADSLRVFFTTDCGETKFYLYNKGGSMLATGPPILYLFQPDSSQWATDTIVLTGAPSVIQIGFECVSYGGNAAYLDNINITSGPATGISENANSEPSLKLYPNPALEEITFQCMGFQTPYWNLEIYNSLGQIVHSRKLSLSGYGDVATADISGLPIGLYQVLVRNGEQVHTAKFIKQ